MALHRVSAAELRGACRRLGRERRGLLAAVLTLVIGMGLNLVVASVLGEALLGPLPYRDSARLVTFVVTDDEVRPVLTDSEVLALRQAGGPVEDVATVERWPASRLGLMDVLDGHMTRRVSGARVTPNFFSLLGATAARGRVFSVAEMGADQNGAVVTDAMWARLFSRRADVIGRTLIINGNPYELIGVLPADFVPPLADLQRPSDVDRALDIYLLQDAEQAAGIAGHGLRYDVLGRLSPHATPAHAAHHLRGVAGRVGLREGPREFGVRTLRATMLAHLTSRYVLVASICVMVLVIAVASAATAIMLRILAQAPAFAMRMALGASTSQVLMVPLVESFAISAIAGTLATFAFSWGTQLVQNLVPLPPWVHAHEAYTWYVWPCLALLVAAASAAGTVMAGGMALRFDASRLHADVSHRRGVFGIPFGWREVLLALQLAVLFAMATPGLVLLGAVTRRSDAASAVSRADVVAAEAWMVERIPFEQVVGRQDAILERVRGLPGVRRASVGGNLPMVGPSMRTHRLRVPDAGHSGGGRAHTVFGEHIDEDHLRILALEVVRGRGLLATDVQTAEPVALVSASVARSLFGDRDALDQYVDWHGVRRIVGVVADAPWETDRLGAMEHPTLFVPRRQDALRRFGLLVECHSPLEAQRVAKQLATLFPEQPFDRIATLDQVVRLAVDEDRQLVSTLLTVGLCGFVLALVALYMNATHLVASKASELAVRVALGGTRAQVLLLLIRSHSQIVGYGVLVGLPAAWWLTLRATGGVFSATHGATSVAISAVAIVAATCAMCAVAGWPQTSRMPVELLRRGDSR
jgi:putative ABC transport system permease protein